MTGESSFAYPQWTVAYALDKGVSPISLNGDYASWTTLRMDCLPPSPGATASILQFCGADGQFVQQGECQSMHALL